MIKTNKNGYVMLSPLRKIKSIYWIIKFYICRNKSGLKREVDLLMGRAKPIKVVFSDGFKESLKHDFDMTDEEVEDFVGEF